MESGLIAHPQLCWIGSAKGWEKVLRNFAILAVEQGFARNGFGDALVQRETDFPTGLPMKIPLAIPHAYPEYVIKPGVGIALLDPPVSFREMGNDEGRMLEVRLVVLMLVTEDIAHNSDLSTIIAMFKDPVWYDSFKEATTSLELATAFQSLFEKTKAVSH